MLTLAASRWARKPTTTTAAPTARATIASAAGVTKRSITTSNTAALPLPPPSATTVAVVESGAKQLSPTATPVTTVAPSVSDTPVTPTASLTKSTSVASSSVSHRHQPTVSNSPSRPLFPPSLALLQSSSPFSHTRAYPSAPLISKINVQAHSTSQPEDNSHSPKLPSSPILLVGTTTTTSPSTSAAASCLPAPLRTLSPSAVPFFPASDPAKKIRPAPAKPKITTADLSLLTTWSDVETNSVAAFFGDTDDNSFSSSPEFTSTDRAPIAASPIVVEPAASAPEVSTEAAEAALTTDAAEATLPAESAGARPLTEVAKAEPEAVTVHSPATIAFISAANAASIRVSAPPASVVKPKEYPKPPQDLKVASPPPSSAQEQEQVQQQTPSPPQSPPPTVAELELAIPTAEKEYSPTMANPKNKGPAVNPYAAFVAACDPDGTMPDGRVYVGTKSHHLDRPAPPRPTAQSAKHTFSFPQSQGRPQGASGPPQFQSQSRPQAQTQAHAQNRPTQSQGAYRAPPNMPSARKPNAPLNNYRGNQPSQPQSGAPQQMRTLADSRWSGRALATAAALPDGFFSTAKAGVTSPTPAPQARPQSTNPTPSPQQQKRQLASNSDQGHNNTQRAFSSMSISNQEKTKTANSPRNSQAPGPQQNTYQQQQPQQPQQQQQRSQGAQANGRSGPHMTPSYQGPSSRSTREDDFSDDDRSSSSVPSRTARPRMSMTQEEIPGNPRFFQYNVGDGCHMVVAMYMEKDASTALARFPQLARVRNDSSSSVKSVDEVTQIFRSAVIEEKESLKDK
ncbi:hypothetical protein BGZ90_010985 [Linnemannia elongata]|nr:hypothetical protein BGZ90_010985 [Linnemannia elongata]